jgi:hypothetical protein
MTAQSKDEHKHEQPQCSLCGRWSSFESYTTMIFDHFVCPQCDTQGLEREPDEVRRDYIMLRGGWLGVHIERARAERE